MNATVSTGRGREARENFKKAMVYSTIIDVGMLIMFVALFLAPSHPMSFATGMITMAAAIQSHWAVKAHKEKVAAEEEERLMANRSHEHRPRSSASF